MTTNILYPLTESARVRMRRESIIDTMVRLNPLYKQAAASSDKIFVLEVAQAHEQAGLMHIAAKLRRQAGEVPQDTLRAKKQILDDLTRRAVEFVRANEPVTPTQIADYLGLTRHAWYKVADRLRHEKAIGFVHQREYVIKIQEELI
jgi:CRP-like cAMP-binding protein